LSHLLGNQGTGDLEEDEKSSEFAATADARDATDADATNATAADDATTYDATATTDDGTAADGDGTAAADDDGTATPDDGAATAGDGTATTIPADKDATTIIKVVITLMMAYNTLHSLNQCNCHLKFKYNLVHYFKESQVTLFKKKKSNHSFQGSLLALWMIRLQKIHSCPGELQEDQPDESEELLRPDMLAFACSVFGFPCKNRENSVNLRLLHQHSASRLQIKQVK
jgi:hypothetical protein